MIKTLISLLAGLTAVACGKSTSTQKDSALLFRAHASIVPIKPNWKEAEIKYLSYFGKYRHSADPVQNYYGDPLGPIVAIWKVTHFLGEKPDFIKCIEPKVPHEIVEELGGFDSPEYKKAKKEYGKLYAKYNKCYFEDNRLLEEKTKKISYYYARTPKNHQPNIPPREPNHAIYEVNLSFGPLGGVIESGLMDEQKAIKDQLDQWGCRNAFDIPGKTKTCYRLPGKESNLYYSVRSILKNPEAAKGLASSPWQLPDFITDVPQDWHEVTGIEITKIQYEHMFNHCEGTVFGCHLADGTPDLNAKQKAYIKTTTWDVDNDIEAREAYAEESDKYRVDKQ